MGASKTQPGDVGAEEIQLGAGQGWPAKPNPGLVTPRYWGHGWPAPNNRAGASQAGFVFRKRRRSPSRGLAAAGFRGCRVRPGAVGDEADRPNEEDEAHRCPRPHSWR